MPLETKVKDVMIPLKDYAAVNVNGSLKDAAIGLRKLYCQTEIGVCTEAGHRNAVVLDDNGTLVGMIDFRSILRVFIPEIAGGITEKLKLLGVSVAFAEAGAEELDEKNLNLRARVVKNAQVPIKEVMLKVKGTIEADADLLEALKKIHQNKITVLPVFEGKTLVGVVRDSDIFLNVASILPS
jgi:CBS domain-containing protein